MTPEQKEIALQFFDDYELLPVIERFLAALPPAVPQPADDAVRDAVAWEVDGSITMRSDLADRLCWNGAWVGMGRAIPYSWKPVLYAAPAMAKEAAMLAAAQEYKPAPQPADDAVCEKLCSYPKCNCPFDAPSDPNWCARGYPVKEKA